MSSVHIESAVSYAVCSTPKIQPSLPLRKQKANQRVPLTKPHAELHTELSTPPYKTAEPYKGISYVLCEGQCDA